MKRCRPIAGALLATLMFVPAAHAAEVDLILPGETHLAPPDTDDRSAAQMSYGRSDPLAGHDAPADWPFDQPGLQTRHFGAATELSCAVGKTPGAIVVINRGSEPLPVGTRIKWQLPGQRGFFALLGPLGAGDTLVADNVLDGAADPGASCTARTI